MAPQRNSKAKVDLDLKIAEKKEKEQSIKESNDKILIDKVSVLSYLLSNSMIDAEKTQLSDPVFKPIMEDEIDIEIIRQKIMELIKKF